MNHLQCVHFVLYDEFRKKVRQREQEISSNDSSSTRICLSDGSNDNAASASVSSSGESSDYPIVNALFARTPYGSSHQKQDFNKKLAVWLFDQMLPYRTVEKETFHQLIAQLDPRVIVPSEKTIRVDMMPETYAKLFNFIKQFVQENVVWFSATVDFWTSKTLHAFMSFAIHFITKDWQRKILVLRCLPFDDEHTADNIGVELQDVLFQWQLETKLATVVTDNGSNLVKALADVELPRSPCVLHTLQLCINNNIVKNPAQRSVVDLLSRASKLAIEVPKVVKFLEENRKKWVWKNCDWLWIKTHVGIRSMKC